MNYESFVGLAVFIIVLLVIVNIWRMVPQTLTEGEEQVTDAAFWPSVKFRDGHYILWLIYTGYINDFDRAPSVDASVFNVKILTGEGMLETPLSGEVESFQVIRIDLPEDALSYSVFYDDGIREYRIIGPKTLPAVLDQ